MVYKWILTGILQRYGENVKLFDDFLKSLFKNIYFAVLFVSPHVPLISITITI